MKEYCSILQACEWIAFKNYPNEDNYNEYLNKYKSKDAVYQEKINKALNILKKILLHFNPKEEHIRGIYYKNNDKQLQGIHINASDILDLKNNGIVVEGENEINIIVFEDENLNKKQYAPVYTDIEIDFSELRKAKYFKHQLENVDKTNKKRGRKCKVERRILYEDIKKYLMAGDTIEPIVEELKPKYDIGRTTIINAITECRRELTQKVNN